MDETMNHDKYALSLISYQVRHFWEERNTWERCSVVYQVHHRIPHQCVQLNSPFLRTMLQTRYGCAQHPPVLYLTHKPADCAAAFVCSSENCDWRDAPRCGDQCSIRGDLKTGPAQSVQISRRGERGVKAKEHWPHHCADCYRSQRLKSRSAPSWVGC